MSEVTHWVLSDCMQRGRALGYETVAAPDIAYITCHTCQQEITKLRASALHIPYDDAAFVRQQNVKLRSVVASLQKQLTNTALPTEISQIERGVALSPVGASVWFRFNHPAHREGTWWIDIRSQHIRLVVNWRIGKGYTVGRHSEDAHRARVTFDVKQALIWIIAMIDQARISSHV